MKLLVLGGMHGNEKLGIALVQSLKERPIAGVDSIIANPRAVDKGSRFTESDLNRSFGEQPPVTYETKRAQMLGKQIAKYDVVLDFHNTQTPDNNCCFVGENCDERLYKVAKQCGLVQCIEATYDCVNKYCMNTISIEISIGDKLDSVEYWRNVITQLRADKNTLRTTPLFMYRFEKRVTWQEQKRFGISAWQPFKQISQKEKYALSVRGDIVPIFIGSRLTDFYATLVTKIGEK